MTLQTEADLVLKNQYVETLMNVATLFAQLDDIALSEGKYIVNKKWVQIPITDADVAEYGFLAVDVSNFFTLMTQFTRLMSNLSVTTMEGRKFSDMLRGR